MTDDGWINDGCRKKALNCRERDILVRDILLRDILITNIETGKNRQRTFSFRPLITKRKGHFSKGHFGQGDFGKEHFGKEQNYQIHSAC